MEKIVPKQENEKEVEAELIVFKPGDYLVFKNPEGDNYYQNTLIHVESVSPKSNKIKARTLTQEGEWIGPFSYPLRSLSIRPSKEGEIERIIKERKDESERIRITTRLQRMFNFNSDCDVDPGLTLEQLQKIKMIIDGEEELGEDKKKTIEGYEEEK